MGGVHTGDSHRRALFYKAFSREAKMYGWPEAELVERAPSAASRVATTVAKSGIDYGESDSLKTVMI